MRVFPESYAFNSSYALFPFSTPATTQDILTKLGVQRQYNFAQPLSANASRPKSLKRVQTFEGCQTVLTNRPIYRGVYGSHTEDEVVAAPSTEVPLFEKWHVEAELSPDVHRIGTSAFNSGLFRDGWQGQVSQWLTTDARRRIEAQSWGYEKGSKHLNILRDVYVVSEQLHH